jgi:hypothetical protein
MGLFDKIREGYDEVELRDEDGKVTRLSPKEYEGLPVDKRVRAILKKQLRFFRGTSEIPMKEALGGRQ